MPAKLAKVDEKHCVTGSEPHGAHGSAALTRAAQTKTKTINVELMADLVLFVTPKAERFNEHVQRRFAALVEPSPGVRDTGKRDMNGVFQVRVKAPSTAAAFIGNGRDPEPKLPPLSVTAELVAPTRCDEERVFELLEHIAGDDLMLRYINRMVVVRDTPFVSLDDVVDAVGRALADVATVRLRIVTSSRRDDEHFAKAFDGKFALSPQDPTHVLFAVTEHASVDTVQPTKVPDANLRFRFGLAPARWANLQYALKRGEAVEHDVSSAAKKIAEALSIAGVKPSGKRLLDIGAAPGGWTMECARRGAALVAAVDPGQLSAEVLAMPNVTYFPHVASACIEQLVALGQFDVLMCDANVVFFEGGKTDTTAAALLADFARLTRECLKPDALVVLTIKLPHRHKESRGQAKRIERIVTGMLSTLDVDRETYQVVHLLANREHERTLLMRPKQK